MLQHRAPRGRTMHVASVDPCGGGCRHDGERKKMMFVLEAAP